MTSFEQPQPQEQPNPNIDWAQVVGTLDKLDSALEIGSEEQAQILYLADNLRIKPKASETDREEYLLDREVEGVIVTNAVGPHIGRRVMNYAASINSRADSEVVNSSETAPSKVANDSEISEPKVSEPKPSQAQFASGTEKESSNKEDWGDYSRIGSKRTFHKDEDGKFTRVSNEYAHAIAEEENFKKNYEEVTTDRSEELEVELERAAKEGKVEKVNRLEKVLTDIADRKAAQSNNPALVEANKLRLEAYRKELELVTGKKNENTNTTSDVDEIKNLELPAPDATKRVDDLQVSHFGNPINPTLKSGESFDAPNAKDRVNIDVDTDIPVLTPPLPSIDVVQPLPDAAPQLSNEELVRILSDLLGEDGFLPGQMTPIVTLEDVQRAQAVENGTATSDEQEQVKNSMFRRVKAALYSVPAKMFSRERRVPGARADSEPMKKRTKVAIGLGGVAAAVGVAYIAHRTGLYDQAMYGADSLSDVEADTLQELLGGSSTEVTIPKSGILDSVTTVTADAGNSFGEANRLAETIASTFTVDAPWQDGDPTAWSWAQGLGIPEAEIENFLREASGVEDVSTWGKSMKVGDSVSATNELVSKYKG